jgi:hypothetical protein
MSISSNPFPFTAQEYAGSAMEKYDNARWTNRDALLAAGMPNEPNSFDNIDIRVDGKTDPERARLSYQAQMANGGQMVAAALGALARDVAEIKKKLDK